jgi:hypothetical protein
MTSLVVVPRARQPVPEHPNLARHKSRSGKPRQRLVGSSWLGPSADGVLEVYKREKR